MDELKELLERKRWQFTMPAGSLDALQTRRRKRRLLAGTLTAITAVVAGIFVLQSVGPSRSVGETSCAFVARFDGRTYEGQPVMIAPVPADPVGYAALPGCKDTNEPSTPAERVKVFRFPGVPASFALVLAGNEDIVLVWKNLKDLPPPVASLVHAPTCRASDVPIRLRGPWLGIIAANGKTELDLLPPYDLNVRAIEASDRRYERARLSVGVTRTLGRPISQADVVNSLRKGGSISITASCGGSHFVATKVRVIGPTTDTSQTSQRI